MSTRGDTKTVKSYTMYLPKATMDEMLHKEVLAWGNHRSKYYKTVHSYYSLGLMIPFVLAFKLASKRFQQLERANLHNGQSCFLNFFYGIGGKIALQIKILKKFQLCFIWGG